MRKTIIGALLVTAVLSFQFCSGPKKAMAAPVVVTYDKDIQTIIQAKCAPCHIAGKGNKKSLDNYTASKDNIDEIISRIQMNPGEHGFMPARNPKLSDSAITAFVDWKKAGLKEN